MTYQTSYLCYQPQSSASVDNSDLGIDNSWYRAQPNPIIEVVRRVRCELRSGKNTFSLKNDTKSQMRTFHIPIIEGPKYSFPIPHPAAIFHTIPPSRCDEHFHPDPALWNPSCSSSLPFLNCQTNYSLYNIDNVFSRLASGIFSRLKNGCSPVCL